MATFAATYEYFHDAEHVATRDETRPAHREWLHEQDALLVSGPTDDDNALLILEGESAAEVEALLDGDPFAAAGVIAARRVVAWKLVSGSWLAPLGLG